MLPLGRGWRGVQLLSGERFEAESIQRIAAALQIPAGELEVAWKAHGGLHLRAVPRSMLRRDGGSWDPLRIVIPNFCEVFNGKRPDLGAHESGKGKMQFGVKARFTPPGTTEAPRNEQAD